MRSDFADLFEVKADAIIRRGRIITEWLSKAACLRTSYVNRDFKRDRRCCLLRPFSSSTHQQTDRSQSEYTSR
nr:glycogen debranching N-terminal domain-containing protein [Mesorhizobium sp.]